MASVSSSRLQSKEPFLPTSETADKGDIIVALSAFGTSWLVKGAVHLRLLFIAMAGSLLSCQPKVLMFKAEPPLVTSTDSVHLSWQTKGRASMSFDRKKIARPPDSVEVLEFTLTATKWGRRSAPEVRQVIFGPAQSRDDLALELVAQQGDTLVYAALKDTNVYRHFNVASQSGSSGGHITLLHGGRQCALTNSGGPSTCMQGLSYAGQWEARMKITAAQQLDRHSIPNTYTILTTITKID